jgi:hypothetical protein
VFPRRDVIESYDNPGSSVYAAKTRDGGSIIEKQGNQYVVDSVHLKTYHGCFTVVVVPYIHNKFRLI